MHTSPGTVGAWAGGFLLCPCEPMNESLETRPLEESSLLVDFGDARLKKQEWSCTRDCWIAKASVFVSWEVGVLVKCVSVDSLPTAACW